MALTPVVKLTLPNPSVPMVDKDGKLSTVWVQFFADLVRRINKAGL